MKPLTPCATCFDKRCQRIFPSKTRSRLLPERPAVSAAILRNCSRLPGSMLPYAQDGAISSMRWRMKSSRPAGSPCRSNLMSPIAQALFQRSIGPRPIWTGHNSDQQRGFGGRQTVVGNQRRRLGPGSRYESQGRMDDGARDRPAYDC